MQTNNTEAASAIVNIGKLYRKFNELESLTSIDEATKDKLHDFRKKILDDLKVIQMIKSKDTEDEGLNDIKKEKSLKEFVADLSLKASKEYRKKHEYNIKMNEKQKIRIALAGETSAGKTTFCNSIFSTNIFFVTQEEATGAAVEIENDSRARVEVYDKNDKIIHELQISPEWFCEDKKNLTDEGRGQVKEFITRYTRVGSEELVHVGRVKVFMPLQQLPKNIVLIDTPGFNANNARSEIAKKVISESHACVFIIDARNALKSKEIKILETIREEVGKTFIVLNKMDLVMADDDLDCDDEDIEVELIDRVKRDLKKRLDMDDVMLYPVCSLSDSSKAEKAKLYIDNLHEFVEKMLTEIVSQRIEFLIDTYAKESIKISNSIIDISKATIENMEEQKRLLDESKPKNFDARIEDIWNSVVENYKYYIQDYKGFMVNSTELNLNNAKNRFLQWVNSSSKKELRNDAQETAELYVKSAVHSIEWDRSRKLKEISSKTVDDVIFTIQKLYDGLPFKAEFNSKKLLQLASTTASIDNSSVRNAANSITSGKGSAVKGAVAGGMAFGPAGALVGAVLGGLLSDSLNTAREKVYDGFVNSVVKVQNAMIKDYDRDVSINVSSSFASKLRNVMVQELNDYVKFINNKIQQTIDNINLLNNEGQIIDANSKEINNIIAELNEWRNERRNISLSEKYVAVTDDASYSQDKTDIDIVQIINSLLEEFVPDIHIFEDEPSNEISPSKEEVKNKILSNKYIEYLNIHKKQFVSFTIVILIAFIGLGYELYKHSREQAYENLMTTAGMYIGKGNYDEAYNLYKQSLKYNNAATIFMSDIDTYKNGIKLMNDKKYLDAIEEFKKIDGGSFSSECQKEIEKCKEQYISQNFEEATNSLNNYQFDNANNYLNNILKINPNNVNAKNFQKGITSAINQNSVQLVSKLFNVNMILVYNNDHEYDYEDKSNGIGITIFGDAEYNNNKKCYGFLINMWSVSASQMTNDGVVNYKFHRKFNIYQDGSIEDLDKTNNTGDIREVVTNIKQDLLENKNAISSSEAIRIITAKLNVSLSKPIDPNSVYIEYINGEQYYIFSPSEVQDMNGVEGDSEYAVSVKDGSVFSHYSDGELKVIN